MDAQRKLGRDMNFEVCVTTYEEGGRTVFWERGLDFVQAVEKAGGYGMTEDSIAEFAKLVYRNLFKDGFLWEQCNIEKGDADPFTVYIGVEL